MQLALDEAWRYQGLTYPNPAVGCCITSSCGELLSVTAHQKAGSPHAEVLALQEAYYKLSKDAAILDLSISEQIHSYLLKHHRGIFEGCSLFTTLEPCSHVGKTPSCATLISQLGIAKVYVGSEDLNPVASQGNAMLKSSGISVASGILKNQCNQLLEPFEKFQKDGFVFFKWAQRLNGTVDQGVISSQSSRELVHKMRSVCDLIVVGGDTVRRDRPTLDARLCGGKACDVLIYSQSDRFDREIPLFQIKEREVIISDSLEVLKNYKNIMIEGGANMYKLTRNIVDLYLAFLAPKFGGAVGMDGIEDQFEILNLYQERQDIIMWMKRVTN